LWLDDFASDRELELEDKLLFEGTIEEDDPMVKMMANLGDDGEWLPWREQMKKDARIIGKIVHYQARILGLLTNVKGKGSPITMGPTSLQIGMNAVMPTICSGKAESIETHHFWVPSLVLPIHITLIICTFVTVSVCGCTKGAIRRTIL